MYTTPPQTVGTVQISHLSWIYFQSGFISGSSTRSPSSHWTSRPSWTTRVPPGGESSLWKIITMRVGVYRKKTPNSVQLLHIAWLPLATAVAAAVGLSVQRQCSSVIGLHPWLRCGGVCSLVRQKRCSVAHLLTGHREADYCVPSWRGSGIGPLSVRAREVECCHSSLS